MWLWGAYDPSFLLVFLLLISHFFISGRSGRGKDWGQGSGWGAESEYFAPGLGVSTVEGAGSYLSGFGMLVRRL